MVDPTVGETLGGVVSERLDGLVGGVLGGVSKFLVPAGPNPPEGLLGNLLDDFESRLGAELMFPPFLNFKEE